MPLAQLRLKSQPLLKILPLLRCHDDLGHLELAGYFQGNPTHLLKRQNAYFRTIYLRDILKTVSE